jgi:LacI family transcriptional regulator
MEAIKEFGLKIPYDISILGFDDIALSNEVIPKLSTMHVKKKTMGRLAVKRLVKILKNEDQVFTKTILSPELLIRESTSVPFIK